LRRDPIVKPLSQRVSHQKQRSNGKEPGSHSALRPLREISSLPENFSSSFAQIFPVIPQLTMDHTGRKPMAPKRDDFMEGFRGTGWNRYSPGYQNGQRWKKALTFPPPTPAAPPTPRSRPASAASARVIVMPRAASVSTTPRFSSPGPRSGSAEGARAGYSDGAAPELLDAIAQNLWPFSLLSNLSAWLDEGSAACRMLLACFAGLATLILVYANIPHMRWMGALAGASFFGGYGALCFTAGALLFGAVALPGLLSRAIAIAVRVAIVLVGGAILAALCYGIYLLLVHFRVF
jgi:hypothetical protein